MTAFLTLEKVCTSKTLNVCLIRDKICGLQGHKKKVNILIYLNIYIIKQDNFKVE